MNQLKETIYQENGYHLHVVPNEKYKTIAFVAKWKAPLAKETITKRALLPYVLKQGTNTYPTRSELQEKLDELYGAVLSIDSTKKGNNHIISVRLEVANDKFIPEESSLIEEAVDLLKELTFYPYTTDGAFSKQVVDREKETLQQKMRAIVDDKMSYANMRMIDEMCSDEVYRMHVQGYEEDLAAITPENLYQYYTAMLHQDQLDIYVSGDVNSQSIRNQIKSFIHRGDTGPFVSNQSDQSNGPETPNTVVEKQSVQQAKLHLGYRTHITYRDDDYFALQVFNGIFGGFPNSKLFLNVREKRSLAYYASSRFESHKGLLFVFSGIAPNDYEEAREIIELQLEEIRNGSFNDAQISETKGLIVNQLLETLDNQQGIIELLYQQVVGGRDLSPNELIEGINGVTKDDIVRVAQKIELDTVYLLTDGGNSNE